MRRSLKIEHADTVGPGFQSQAEMYVQGVSTRKVKAITEELCGHSFSASTISEATARLDCDVEGVFRAPAGRGVSLFDFGRAL